MFLLVLLVNMSMVIIMINQDEDMYLFIKFNINSINLKQL